MFKEIRKKALLFASEGCSDGEKQCLEYLYTYMPFPDLTDYSSELFLKFVRHGLMVRRVMPWCKNIEESDFLNYVLQYRVNNENIEFYSQQFYSELYDRVKDLSMYQAVVEVNYWCLEKATYQGTNIRTASPLTIIKNAYGRCGEEAVLTVAALRSVGIPARQCYTPRWAHCDDNHAWVEAKIDGTWHFLGACEPEVRLDTGWFAHPASKAMLVHNKVFSNQVSGEIITRQTEHVTEINLLSHYADIKQIKITVVNEEDIPLEHKKVSFLVVNSGETYPLATIETNQRGEAVFATGLGDLINLHMIKNAYVYEKLDVRKAESLKLTLPSSLKIAKEPVEFKLVPPAGGINELQPLGPKMEKLQTRKNDLSVEKRRAYEASFFTEETARFWLLSNDIYNSKGFEKEITDCLINARGNHHEIEVFLKQEDGDLKYKILLLTSLQKKDLTDCKAEVLMEFLMEGLPYKDEYEEAIFTDYILCPRIGIEMITPYKKRILNYFSKEEQVAFRNKKQELYQYIEEHIMLYEETEYANINTSPGGVLDFKLANAISRKILLVAVLRTIGIPAKIEPSDGRVVYYENGQWMYIETGHTVLSCKTGTLILTKEDGADLEYHKNYSVALLKDGLYSTVNLEEIPWDGNQITYSLEPGHYQVLTSNRQIDGTNLILIQYITVSEYKKQTLGLRLLEGQTQKKCC